MSHRALVIYTYFTYVAAPASKHNNS